MSCSAMSADGQPSVRIASWNSPLSPLAALASGVRFVSSSSASSSNRPSDRPTASRGPTPAVAPSSAEGVAATRQHAESVPANPNRQSLPDRTAGRGQHFDGSARPVESSRTHMSDLLGRCYRLRGGQITRSEIRRRCDRCRDRIRRHVRLPEIKFSNCVVRVNFRTCGRSSTAFLLVAGGMFIARKS